MKNVAEKNLSPIERATWIAVIAGTIAVIYLIPESILQKNLCLFKLFTGMDCPLCGMTESVHLAVRGKMFASLSKHPLGAALFAAMLVFAPFVAAGKIPPALARYTVLFFVSGFAAWWLLKTFFI